MLPGAYAFKNMFRCNNLLGILCGKSFFIPGAYEFKNKKFRKHMSNTFKINFKSTEQMHSRAKTLRPRIID
jgi:hypothetical protein